VASKSIVLEAAGREVTVSNPDKVYFPERGYTKRDLVEYYLAVDDGALRGVSGRPMALKRFVEGAAGDFFFQKRAPKSKPDWIETVELSFPSGRTADEVVLRDVAQLAWIINLGCIDLNPHPTRAEDLEHPDELRVDLDPVPGVPWSQIRDVAMVAREALADVGLVGWPKTSGSRGIHVNVRIEPRWTFPEVRRAALALARDVERRAPDLATSKWWKEERHGVFLDYNQNAKDRTVASVYSVRPTPDARVSMPLRWEDVPDVEPEDFTLATVPDLYAKHGDPGEGIDDSRGSLEALLDLSARHEAEGLGDAPWPPHYQKQEGEPPRVMPSRRRMTVPVIEIAKAERKDDALAGLDRWKARHPEAAQHLEPADVLVDAMRGRFTTWTRIRVNLVHVPEDRRPPQEELDPDYDPTVQWQGVAGEGPQGRGAATKVSDDEPAADAPGEEKPAKASATKPSTSRRAKAT
jgi:DNA ligase D-like protein (predicted polymerase)